MEKRKKPSFEQKLIRNAAAGLCISATLALGKLVIGLFTDYNLISIAIYTFAILFAKLQCVLGAKTDRKTFEQRNKRTAVFLFVSSVLYVGFMCRMLIIARPVKNNGLVFVVTLAFISFCELGFAIAGLFLTKNKGHYYQNIKIINFCMALIAILTTQTAILDMMSQGDVSNIANAYAGIGVGCFIALCAVYILISPKTSVIDREHNKFMLKDASLDQMIDMQSEKICLTLCKSFVYGDYVFNAKIEGDVVEGDIERGKSLWRRMHVLLKILCCILSEILVFVWLIGRAILFLRSTDLPKRLEKMMASNGFEKIQ